MEKRHDRGTSERFHFSAWTVAQREAREGARRWANYQLRVGAGLAGVGLLWWAMERVEGPITETGMAIFLLLHILILFLIVCIVPGMAADCIARERREGTVGLLFLTSLTARGVVIGKSLAQGLRAFTLWLAFVPMLTIPFLTGGVTRIEAIQRLALEFGAAVICMAAGITASAWVKSRAGVFLLSYGLAGTAIIGTLVFLGALENPVANVETLARTGLRLVEGINFFGPIDRIPAPPWLARWGVRDWMVLVAVALAISTLCLYAAVEVSATALDRLWRDRPPSARRISVEKKFCTPISKSYFRDRMRKKLERNPIVWLQEYSWKARAAKWGICGAFLAIDTALLVWFNVNGSTLVFDIQPFMAMFLASAFVFACVNGFLNEKRSGALELLLVTPIPAGRLITGRTVGLWRQFLPGWIPVLAGFVWLQEPWTLASTRSLTEAFSPEGHLPVIFVWANVFLTLPVFATYSALRVKNLMGATGLTLAGLILVYLFAICLADPEDVLRGRFNEVDWTNPIPYVALFLCNVGFVRLTFVLLRHSLSRRIYAF